MSQLEPSLGSKMRGLDDRPSGEGTAFDMRLKRELPERLGKGLSELTVRKPGLVSLRVDKGSLLELCKLLKESYGFDHVTLISAVDWLDRLELVYHIYSYENICMAEVKVNLPRDDPRVESVSSLWGGADWHEREAYDMMGVIFEHHPGLRRILLPEEFEYFPLRKDFEME